MHRMPVVTAFQKQEPRVRAWVSNVFYSLIFLVIVLSRSASAQGITQFVGHVTDSSGAAIPEATVTVHSEDTGVDTIVKTTAAGDYTVPYVKPGTYTITADLTGFKSVSRIHIHLDIDQSSTMNFTLPVGDVSETVTVLSDASQIDLSKGDRGEVIGAERVSELPLDGRNPFGLFTLSPGTHSFEASQYPRPFDLVTHQLYANGSPQPVELNIDGVTNEAGAATGAAGFVPSVDVLGEYKVVLNPYDASYSHGGGSSIDLSLKSGANAFHGTVNYFMRRSWLDADPWQAKYNASLSGTSPIKPNHKRDQFSGEGSGPIVIPYLYNGRDKLFYVVAYEEIKDITPNSIISLYSIPNPAWANGDFSTAQFFFQQSASNKGANPCGAGVPSCLQPLKIYDALSPLHTVVDPIDLKTKTAHSQFLGNMIPMNRLDPVGQAIFSAYRYVTPNNNPGAGYAPYTNNLAVLPIENDTWRNALIKIDWKVRGSDTLSFRWGGQGRWNNPGLGTSGLPLNDPANIAGAQTQPKAETGAIQWTHTFSPVLLLNVGTTLISEAEVKSDYGPTFANESAALGFNPAYYNQLSNNNRFPYVTLSGLPNANGYDYLSNTSQGSSRVYHTLQFLPTLTNVRGAHTIRTGIDIRFTQNDNPGGGANDSYSFTNNFSNQYYNYADPTNYTSGSSAASLLLGYPNGGTTNANLHSFYSQHYFAPWAQDDWKLTNRLTLNLGLRWDFLTPLVERHNKLLSAFNLTVLNRYPPAQQHWEPTPTCKVGSRLPVSTARPAVRLHSTSCRFNHASVLLMRLPRGWCYAEELAKTT